MKLHALGAVSVLTGSALLAGVLGSLTGCGDEEVRSSGDGAGAAGTGGNGAAGHGRGGVPNAQCDPLAPVDVSGAVAVGTEGELRAALAVGGVIELTADVAATAPFEVVAETVVDGGGFSISGGDSTHLFVARRVDFTIQNVTLRDGNNQVADGEHFSRRSGAAIMASGGSSSEGPAEGSLQVIDVVFDSNRTKASGPGDIRGGAVYVFRLPDATISGSTFTGNVGSNGGAIGGLGSSLSVIGSRFIGNQTNGPGDVVGEGTGGAISLDAVSQNEQTAYLNICGCEFRDNQALNTGGAVYLVAHGYTMTDVTIDQSLFEGNLTASSTGGQGGAIFLMDDEKSDIPVDPARSNRAAITNSLFVENETLSRGGGVWYWTRDGRLTVSNTTFASNQTTADDTGMGGGVAISTGPADFVNVTFAQNYAKFHGGGVQMGGDAQVSLQNCLFYENTSDREGGWANFHTNREVDVDLGGNMQFLSPELVIDGNSDALVSESAVRADPLLQGLADNGGPTHTMALGAGSPAIDAGVANGAPATDQRGEPRDGAPDIGAYEAQ